MTIRVAIMGFGRIGRNVFRALYDRSEVEIVAINDIAPSEAMEYLLRYDTLQGRFSDPVRIMDGNLFARGRRIPFLQFREPGEIPWYEYGADVVVEATGQYRNREDLQKHLDMGLKVDAPIEHIPYFVPPPQLEVVPEGEESPHPRPYFLFVGRLEKMKGVQVLLETFRNYHMADLLIAGDGTYESELRRQAEGLENVHFLGRMEYSKLQALFRHAIAQVVSSIGYETLGIVILEAFAQRTPAIVNNLGALPEIVEQSGGGFIYDDQESLVKAMETLRTNPGLRKELGNRGYEAYYKYWTPEAYLPQYFDLIERAAAQKGAGPLLLEKANNRVSRGSGLGTGG